jgi:hypothetical protein
MSNISSHISSSNKSKNAETLDTLTCSLNPLSRGSCNSSKPTKSIISTFLTRTAFPLSPHLCLHSSSPLPSLRLKLRQPFLLLPIPLPLVLTRLRLTNGSISSTSRTLSTAPCLPGISMSSSCGMKQWEPSLRNFPQHLLTGVRIFPRRNQRKPSPRKKRLQRFFNQPLN